MDENKNLNEVTEEVAAENTEITETEESTVAVEETTAENEVNTPKKEKPNKLLKNQALFKKGGYSLAITAAVLAALIIFNIFVGVLGERLHLEFDMTTAKDNSISAENVKYIKGIKDDINITVCANADDYTGGYMAYYAQQYNVYDDSAADYYEQTVKLINEYDAYNKKISVEFIDTQDAAFTALSSKYAGETITYGDIIVSSTVNGNERHKIVGYKDIYELKEDSTYSQYGYSYYAVGGNNIETALTSAIAYVTATETKKIAFITGHSSNDYTAAYKTLLNDNNFVCEDITDSIITSIPSDYDAVAIVAPTSDFIASEIEAISDFLDNDGDLGKGLVFFADISSPYLTNLYDYLAQWGIEVGEGVLFETNSNNHIPNDELTMGMYSAGEDEMISDGVLCITGYNVPITTLFDDEQNGMDVNILVSTPETVVVAPQGTTAGWNGSTDYTKASYVGAVQSKKTDYDKDNNEITNYVYAFSSVDFIDSEFAEESSVSNKDVVLAASERAMHAEDTGIKFISKVITNENYQNLITETSANIMRFIFMLALPIIIIAIGVVVYIKRRNA